MGKLSDKSGEKIRHESAYLYERQWRRLDAIAGVEGLRKAEVLREIVDYGLRYYDSLPETGGSGGGVGGAGKK